LILKYTSSRFGIKLLQNTQVTTGTGLAIIEKMNSQFYHNPLRVEQFHNKFTFEDKEFEINYNVNIEL
jgi:hypothetical protein